MADFIALMKNGKYKVISDEIDVFKKKDKIEYLLVPTDTKLKGVTYTMIEGHKIQRIENELLQVSTIMTYHIDDQYYSEPSLYQFQVNNIVSACNVYPFVKIFQEISMFTTQHPACMNILANAQINEYPSTTYPYRLNRDKFERGYHSMIINFILHDGMWHQMEPYESTPEEFTAIFVFNLYAHDGYLFTQETYESLYEGKLYVEVTVIDKVDFPTDGDTIITADIKDTKSKLLDGGMDTEYMLDLVDALLVVPQVIMYFTQVMNKELYLLVIWNDQTHNILIHPNDAYVKYSLYNLLFNN